MTNELKEFIERAQDWPKKAQEEAVEALREIEEDFIIGPETRKRLDRAHEEVLRGEGFPLSGIKKRLGM